MTPQARAEEGRSLVGGGGDPITQEFLRISRALLNVLASYGPEPFMLPRELADSMDIAYPEEGEYGLDVVNTDRTFIRTILWRQMSRIEKSGHVLHEIMALVGRPENLHHLKSTQILEWLLSDPRYEKGL